MQRDPDGQIKLEQRGHLLLIGVDRPEKRNGFTPKLFSELASAYSRLESTPQLWCGVVYAVPFKNFSEPWIQYESRADPSELKRRPERRAIPLPW